MLLIDLATAYFIDRHAVNLPLPTPAAVSAPATPQHIVTLPVRIILPAPTPASSPRVGTPMPTYGDVIQTAYGPMTLQRGSFVLSKATPQYGAPTASSPVWSTFPAGAAVHTAGYVDRPDGRWYEVIYDGTGWIKLT